MGIRDLFHRGSQQDAEGSAGEGPGGSPPQPVAAAEPGSVSSPLDVEGQGTVGLSDRTAPGGQASPDTNQGKAEPMPASPGQADPNAPLPVPDLAQMNVGSADPQAPSHPAAHERDVPQGGDEVHEGGVPYDGAAGSGTDGDTHASGMTTGPGSVPGTPASAGDGRAQRQPGSLGDSPEEQHSDVAAGARAMRPAQAGVGQPGDSQGVSVPSDQPSPGTSEQQDSTGGVRTPTGTD